jgi:hypothetical protein
MKLSAARGLSSLLVLLAALVWSEQEAAGMGWVWVLAEQHDITSGDFRGFAMGSTKEIAAQNLVKLGARDLMSIPVPPELAVTTRDPADVANLVSSRNGIRIADSQGLDIRLYFEGDRVVGVDNRGTASPGQRFSATQTRDSVNNQLRMLLQENPRVQIESVGRTDSAYWGMVNRDNEKAVNTLAGYDGWHFIVPTEKPGGATYRLFFRNDRLIRLQYERPRFKK